MSKRLPANGKSPSEKSTTRSRAARPADATTPAAPKAPRTRRKATAPAADNGAVIVETTEVMVVGADRRPTHDEIAIRAYFISLERGADPVAAWLLAERELTAV